MPMSKHPIGTDDEGNPVNVVWGADLNWAHGFAENNEHKQCEYYRAQGKDNAHYAVVRELTGKFEYWYVTMHIDGHTSHLDTECMNAYEGQEICQIFESERAHVVSKEHARARIEDKTGE
jgi:hypothetical protein